MKLVTFQSMESLKFLEKNGYLICDEKYIDLNKAQYVYKWVLEKMNKNVKNNTNARYPLWTWVKCYNGTCPPKRKGKRVEGFDVKITFHKDKKDVFITDFRRYSFILSNVYIPKSIKDKEKMDELLKEKNIKKDELKALVRPDKYKTHRTDKEYKDICKTIRESWDRCITEDSNILQGCVWRIDKEDIDKIEILKNDGYTYGSVNYVRANGKRKNWIEDFYKILRK